MQAYGQTEKHIYTEGAPTAGQPYVFPAAKANMFAAVPDAEVILRLGAFNNILRSLNIPWGTSLLSV